MTANYGRETKCSCAADFHIDETLYSNLKYKLLEYNAFDCKNWTLFIQGIVL